MILGSILLYWVFAYNLLRTDYIKLVALYTGLFVLFYSIIQRLKHNTKTLTYLAFGCRAIFILAIPNLSQDFYRFIWDGRMILEGINPYLHTVESFISQGQFPVAQAIELRAGMGDLNASHFTNYPPINQLCFAIAALFSGKSILGSVVVMEGVMIFFLVWSLYLLYKCKWLFAGVVLALSISVKLIPLIFLPLFFQWFIFEVSKTKLKTQVKRTQADPSNVAVSNTFSFLKTLKNTRLLPHSAVLWPRITKLIGFYAIVILTTLILFAPFYASEFINNYSKTVALWFQNFEFNGSLYYIAREVGYLFRGYNEIAIIGKASAILVILFVLIITFFRQNRTPIAFITAMLLVLSFYYFTTTTVHPWYVATLLILSVFTKYKFPLVWSFVIILSYLAYINLNRADKSENLWVIALEYAIVYGVFIWEVFIKKAPKLEA